MMVNWQTKKLGDLTQKIGSGVTPRGGSDVFVDDGVFFIRSQNIRNNKVDMTDRKYIPKSIDEKMRSSRVQKNDILYNITGASIGRSAVYKSSLEANVNQHVCIVRIKEDSPKFVQYALSSEVGARNLWGFQAGGNREGLNFQQLASFKIKIPEKPEQERIVGVLEVWDEYIEKLEQKIALKEQLKKGLMQQLLTGKRRLLGFNSEWHEVKLNDLVSITTGRKDVNQGNPDGEYPFFTCSRRHTYSDEYSFDDEAILIAGNGDVGHCKYYKGKFEAYQRTYVLTGFDKVSAQYIFPFLQHYFQNFIDAQKQMGAMPFIKVGMLKDFKVVLPIDKDEQESIAGLVADANDEISFLTDKMKAIKLQKKYLLKNLITGTIRTPEDLQPLDASRLERSAL